VAQDEDSKIMDEIALKKKKKVFDPDTLLQVGKTIPAVRIKEFNFFDGRPVLSMKEDVLGAPVLDYNSLKVGETVFATIDSINPVTKSVTLKISDFVRGILPIEHMAEHPVKVIPPKLTEVGKQIKVRVFALEDRQLVFTKKDTLLKDKVTVFASSDAAKKGDKLYGVVVGKTEYGFVVRSFGGVKGLLTFEDVKKSSKVRLTDIKEGSVVKAYVLFHKRDAGVALTLNKKQVKTKKETDYTDLFEKFGPTEEEVQAIKLNYGALMKDSGKEDLVG
jgi:ribosomal protein S1